VIEQEHIMAALRKDEARISPIQKVKREDFERFLETLKNPPKPSEKLRASVAAMGRQTRSYAR
jgi:uncharacterized protein (DUF1778 family)